MTSHLTKAATYHTLLLSSKVHELSLENRSLKSSVHTLESKNRRLETDVVALLVDNSQLKDRVASLEEKVKLVTGSVYKFTMPNFYKYRHKNKEWCSLPFYSHQQGYKMCLICNASSKGDDAYLSVYVCLMTGEFDDFLEWPLRGELTIHLLDQSGSERHCSQAIAFDHRGSQAALERVRYGQLRAETGVGFPKFMRLYDLHPRYLKDDRLLFKITDIKCIQ
jgi:TNF receptor-associated factor 4